MKRADLLAIGCALALLSYAKSLADLVGLIVAVIFLEFTVQCTAIQLRKDGWFD